MFSAGGFNSHRGSPTRRNPFSTTVPPGVGWLDGRFFFFQKGDVLEGDAKGTPQKSSKLTLHFAKGPRKDPLKTS